MERKDYFEQVSEAFRTHPAVALLSPRQCGKTTFARMYAKSLAHNSIHFFDLEDPRDLIKLEKNPTLTLEELPGLIIIDEVQRLPTLFPILRVLIDKPDSKQRFLILGSASRDLIQFSSETLAGRIAHIEMTPFNFSETHDLSRLWIRGGFPKSYLAETDKDSDNWRHFYITTFLERDMPALGIKIPPQTMRRFWMMLAHYHGNIFNASEIGRSLGAANTTIRNYLDILSGVFMIRQLQPWQANIKKRQVKSPKIYFRDSGIFHTLIGIENFAALRSNPKLGASWEGLALEEIIRHHQAESEDCYFWATHTGAELDLMIIKSGKKLGFEIKYTESPKITPSMINAQKDLQLDQLTVIVPSKTDFPLTKEIRAIGLENYLKQTQT